MWKGVTDMGMFSPGGGTEQYISTRSSMILSSVIRMVGNAWSTAALYQPLILLHASWGRGRSPVRIHYASSPAISVLRILSYFRAALIFRPIRLIRDWYLPSYCHTKTLSSMSLDVASEIHGLWCASPFSTFRTARLNSENILPVRIFI